MTAAAPALDRALIADGVATANIPTLLMVLYQMTGEHRWLEAPYRPNRATGLGDNDSGGLPEATQAEIREAAREAIMAWAAGRPLAIPEPAHAELVEMLSVAMGEPVPPEYGAFTESLLGERALNDEPIAVPEGFHVLVVGAGMSGICAGANLAAAGVPFTILEKNDDIGGVWLENHYPGAGVDTPNHLYAFSFAVHDWPVYFALRDNIHKYLSAVADRFKVREHVRFGTRVTTARYDEVRQIWQVQIQGPDGTSELLEGNVLIGASGIFNPPVWPQIPGLEDFDGPVFHTAEWRDDVDIDGRKVAIIGNGASCMQTGPEIQHRVESLTIFQRSPHWAAPFEQFRREVPEAIRYLLREVPIYQAWYRVRLGWMFNDRLHDSLQKDPDWAHPDRALNATNDAHRAFFTHYIKSELGDRTDLLEKVLPTYPPFGKRMLLDNGWYRMLRNERVSLVNDRVARIEPHAIVTEDGTTYDADVLVIATGFDVLRFINTYEVIGRDGRSLREAWDDDNASAYLGTVVPGFPNFFTLYGPNLQPGHGGSLVVVVEMQVNYVMDMIRRMAAEQIGAVDCRREVHESYMQRVDDAHTRMVWTHPGMTTYYRNDRGRIVVNSPFRNVDYFEWTRQVNLEDYETEARSA
ncbi:MAG: NAD(P)-binding domain-containing protein [Gammaproteobacteria bacterium]